MRATPSTGWRRGRVVLLALFLAAGSGADDAGALTDQPAAGGELIDPSEIPSVHNTFYKVPEGVVSWDLLADLVVTHEVIAPLRTVFHTDYPDAVKALDGQEVKVMGFLYPLEGGREHAHFLLTAWPPSCPFCLPAGPAQMVEVFTAEPVEFTEGAILLAGEFDVLYDDPTGLYYRLHGARLVERFDDIRWTGQLPAQPLQ